MDREQIRPLGKPALGAVESAASEHDAWSLAEHAIGDAAVAAHDALADIEEIARELTHRIEAAKAKGRMDAGDR
jgi:hypothetical protein